MRVAPGGIDHQSAPEAASGGCAVDGELRETTFLLPFPFATPFYPIFVAESLGYYEDEGLKVNIEFATSTAWSTVRHITGHDAPARRRVLDLAISSGRSQVAVRDATLVRSAPRPHAPSSTPRAAD